MRETLDHPTIAMDNTLVFETIESIYCHIKTKTDRVIGENHSKNKKLKVIGEKKKVVGAP